MAGDRQIQDHLLQACDLLDTRHRAWLSDCDKLEEQVLTQVRARFAQVKSDAETWKREGQAHLRSLVDKFIRNEDQFLRERLLAAPDELQPTLDAVCSLPLPSIPHLDSISLQIPSISARLDTELPLSPFGHKLFLLSSDLTSLIIINLLRMESQKVLLKGGDELVPNSVWTVLSTGELFVCGGGQ